ncbi:MAG TPA: acyl-CoA dehydrogenase family protein [Polyangiaceae bacterium]|nr:acyl-CoA dehydrogenase family protein [Polyangiaceae bacterium]
MIAFAPNEDQRMMIDAARQLGRTLAGRIREFEKAAALPADVRKTAHDMGLGTAYLPEAVGGAGLGMVTAVLLEEEIAAGDPAAAFGLGGPGAFGLAMTELGTAEQAKEQLGPFFGEGGHDLAGAVAFGEPSPHRERAGFSTLAKKAGDGFQLFGKKAFVQDAERADRFVVFAQLDESKGYDGLGAFVVHKGDKGVAVTPRVRTLGLDLASFGGLELEGARASTQLLGGGDLRRATVRFFAKHGLLIAARCVGLSRAAFDVTRDYVEGRRAFGKPVGHFQAVAFTVADRAMDVEAARALLWRAAWLWDSGADENAALLASARAVAHAHQTAMRCGDDGVQLHGGAGFMRDYPVEKYMRDAKQLALCGLPSACAEQLAAAIELGREPDLGLVLPWPESQSAFV